MGVNSGHNIISPSGAHRWIACPPSALLCAQADSADTDYSREGTLAHALAEHKLRTNGADTPQDIRDSVYYNAEMEVHTDNYVDFCRALEKKGSIWFTEHPVPCYYSSDDTDCIIDRCFFNPATGEIDIVDLKYGKGYPVSAEMNPQLRIYGACFAKWIMLQKASNNYPEMKKFTDGLTKVNYYIFQPRIDYIKDWSEPFGNLCVFMENEVIPAAKKAVKGDGELNPGEKQCKFCAVAPRCKALASEIISVPKNVDFKDPRILTNDEFKQILPLASMVSSWFRKVNDEALNTVLKGAEIPGYKLVAGRSVRSINNPEPIKAYLTFIGHKREDYIKESLVGIPELEKIIGKKEFAQLFGPYVDKPKGKPTLVPIEDKRDDYKDVKSEFEKFFIKE